MTYGKLVNGRLVPAPNPLPVRNGEVRDPSGYLYAAVNIVFANTKSLDGKVYGQMVLQLPADESAQARVLDYMQHTGLAFSEEVYTDGN